MKYALLIFCICTLVESPAQVQLDSLNYYFKTGQEAKAIPFLNQAIEEDSLNAHLYFALGCVYHASGNNQRKAIYNYSKALQLDSNNYGSHYNLGSLYSDWLVSHSCPAGLDSTPLKEPRSRKEEIKLAIFHFEKYQEHDPCAAYMIYCLKRLYDCAEDLNLNLGEYEELCNSNLDN